MVAGGDIRVAVKAVDLENLNEDLEGLQDYQQVLVFFQLRGAVVGQTRVPVVGGKAIANTLRQRLAPIAWPVWLRWIEAQQLPPETLPGASVIVCTRDRTSDLAQLIPHLSQLAARGYQIIVVDNCPSNESTFRLVMEYPEIKYVLEPRPGLDTARNRGLKEADGDIIAFIDDDAIPGDDWPGALLRNFSDPMVAVVTGLTLPMELETQAQQWFEKTNSFGRGFERRSFEAQTMSVLGTGQVGAGVNMAIRRSALAEIGLFDEALDGGTPTLSGGDQEFFYRTLAHGFRIIYDPAAYVWHRHRRDWEVLRRTIYGYGVGLYAWWARALLFEGEWTVLFWGSRWFFGQQVKNLIRALLRRPGHVPLDLAWAEFSGALVGPLRYLQSHHRLRKQSQPFDHIAPVTVSPKEPKKALSSTKTKMT
jgi:GT2 family glycosyltransferase